MLSLPLLFTRKISYPFCNKIVCLYLSYSNTHTINRKIIPFNPPQKATTSRKKKELLEHNRSLQNIFIYLPFFYQGQFYLLDFSKKKKLPPPTAFFQPNSHSME